MSDVFEGPGWWLASDGKWYAPHLHGDPEYRNRFAERAVAPEPVAPIVDTEPVVPATAAPIVEPIRQPVVELGMPDPVVNPVPGSVAEMLVGGSDETPDATPPTVASSNVPDIDVIEDAEIVDAEVVDADAVQPPSEPNAEEASESYPARRGASTPTPVSEILNRVDQIRKKEAVEKARAAGQVVNEKVDVAPDGPHVAIPDAQPPFVQDHTTVQPRASRARLELGNIAEQAVTPPIVAPATEPSPSPSQFHVRDEDKVPSTDLVPVPKAIEVDDGPEMMDRLVAAALFVSGVAMIVGTFMAWDVGPRVQESGWELGDGIATIAAGVIGSAAAGPIFVGFRHAVPRAMAIVCGLIGVVVVGLSGIQAVSDSVAAGTTVGNGFWVVLIGALAMLTTGVIDRNRLAS